MANIMRRAWAWLRHTVLWTVSPKYQRQMSWRWMNDTLGDQLRDSGFYKPLSERMGILDGDRPDLLDELERALNEKRPSDGIDISEQA